MATRPARAATRREIDSLIRVHPYSDPTTAQSITTPSGYRASRIRCGVGFLFLPSSRRAPAEFTQTKPKSVRHFTSAVEMGFTSGTNGLNGHPRAFPLSFLSISYSPSFSYIRRAPYRTHWRRYSCMQSCRCEEKGAIAC